MRFRVELRDNNFNIKEILDNEYLDLGWSYSRIGGCGDFSFNLPRKRFEEKAIRGDFNIRIYNRNESTNTHDLWYQGFVKNKTPSISGKTENIAVSGHGYASQLDRIYINNVTYTGQEISVIVKSLLDNYIVPYTDITYDAGDILATDFTPDSIQFNESARSCMEKLADLAGAREWGVGKNRDFFFWQRSEVIGFRKFLGKDIIRFEDNQDFDEIVNYILVQGAQVGGTYFTFGPYQDTPSQLKYSQRQRVIQNSSVTTESVASQLADATLQEFSEVSRRATCEMVNVTAQIESTIPIPLFSEISRKIKYGQKRYGTFLYSGTVSRLINRINYDLSNEGSLRVRVDLDRQRPLISEQIGQIEYKLEQTRSASL